MPFRALYRTLLPALGRTALKIATVSAFSKQELARHPHRICERIFVAPNGHEHVLSLRRAIRLSTRAAASPDTIVLIGSPAPHKNTTFILRHGRRAKDAGPAHCRGRTFGPARLRSIGARVERPTSSWLGRISDEELAALLQDSLCLAFPSLTEGFGLPALEAMAIGCPVVTSDRASLPEVCAHAALYADPARCQRLDRAFQRR